MTGWIVSELLVGRFDRPRTWPRVVMYTTIVMLLLASTKPSTFALPAPSHLTEDGYAILSLNIAVNRSFCGAPSSISTGEGSGRVLFGDPNTSHQPVRNIINARWGSIERYCATVKRPFTNNENSLMVLESWAWRLAPNLSLLGVGRVLLAIKLALLAFFCMVSLRLGTGMLLCYAILDVSFALLGQLQQNFAYSNYSFLLCMVMATIALYPLMLNLPIRSRGRQLLWPGIAGVWTAFVINMRTSYLPLCVACGLIYLCALSFESRVTAVRAAESIRGVAAAVIFFGIGYGLFHYSFIAQRRAADSAGLAYHTLFHPLVLSIGLPTNTFSEREGIQWDDNVGLTLAHRVNPSAVYLTKGYEQALATYYFGLWKRYPAEMIRVYFEKSKLAGTEMMTIADVPDLAVGFARGALRLAPNGLWLLSLLAGFTAVAGWRFIRVRSPILMLMMLMGLAATMLMLESMLIVPRYYLTYHAPLLLLYCSATFVIIQIAFNNALGLWRSAAATNKTN